MSYPPDSPPEEPEVRCPRCQGYMTWVQKDYCFVCENDPTIKDVIAGNFAERKDGTKECIGRLEGDDFDWDSAREAREDR